MTLASNDTEPLGSQQDAESRRRVSPAWAVCLLLFLAIALVYGQTLGQDFIQYDDQIFVAQNRHVASGLTREGARWAFTDGPAGERYPLTMLSHMLDCQLFDLHSGGHHLTNLLLHAAASIVLFLVWWRMTAERAVPGTDQRLVAAGDMPTAPHGLEVASATTQRAVPGTDRRLVATQASGVRADAGGPERNTLWPSAFVAAVFALHPQHVESVAWISERRDVLSGLFFMLTLAAYLEYVRQGRSIGRYLLVALPLALGLMAKAMLVTVPALLVLLDFWPLARIGRAGDKPNWTGAIERPTLAALLIEKLPLFALAAGGCLIEMRTHNHPAIFVPWSVRLGNAAVSCVLYLAQFFWPANLALFYPLPKGGWPIGQVAAAVALLTAVSAAAVIWRRRCPYLFVGWFWYLGMLTPVLGLVQVAAHARADRYMYLPSVGLTIALTWGAVRLFSGSLAHRRLLAVVGVVAIVLLIPVAFQQTRLWGSDEALWAHAVACTSDNAKAEECLADALAAEHRDDEAIALYRQAQQHSGEAGPYNSLGVLLRGEGRLDEAIEEFRQALARAPDYNLAEMNLGSSLALQGQLDEAMRHLRRAVELDPKYIGSHVELARVLAQQKQFDEALAELEQAVDIDPSNSIARNDLGTTLFHLGRIDEATAAFASTVALAPNSAFAHVNFARALMVSRRFDEAIAEYQRALELDPKNADARRELEKFERRGP